MAELFMQDAAQDSHHRGDNVVDYFQRRGYLDNVTDEAGLRAALSGDPATAYIGFDPTASSLHVGHQLGIMMLSVLQRFGHRPIALGGGGTALVGDPTGRTSTRDALALDQIEGNLSSILLQFDRFLDFSGNRFGDNPPALLINNADWLLDLNYIAFLRDIGQHFSVNEMLAVDTYRQRFESGAGLNFVEFNYRIVQAYDFLHLFRTKECILQMGGSDQWGNITAGVDLIRRVESAKAYGLVSPLLTTASGQKMGKTAGNSVWLDPNLTSPYDYYQYWINVDDADVGKLLRLYTFVPDERISELTATEGVGLRGAKQVLAREVTALAHGTDAALEAESAARALFSADSTTSKDIAVPTTEIPRVTVAEGLSLAEAFVRAELVTSRNEARRLAKQGGLRIDDQRLTDVDQLFDPPVETMLFKVGKKRIKRVVIN